MSPLASIRDHTNAIVGVLKDLFEPFDMDVPVGRGSAEGLEVPYVVVYNIPGGGMSGSLENPFEDADLVYQVTCVGKNQEQAEWLVDQVMVLVEGFEVEGRSIALVTPDGGPGVRPDKDETPPVFFSTPRFTVKSTPA